MFLRYVYEAIKSRIDICNASAISDVAEYMKEKEILREVQRERAEQLKIEVEQLEEMKKLNKEYMEAERARTQSSDSSSSYCSEEADYLAGYIDEFEITF